MNLQDALKRAIRVPFAAAAMFVAAGSYGYAQSLELVEGRVLRGEYPAGYKPKRDTKLMPPRTDLAAEIPALHAFLVWSRQP